MRELFTAISRHFDAGEPVVLAMVIDGQGSAPRKPGAKMAFFQDGATEGTIGGGALEAAVEKAVAGVWAGRGALLLSFNLQKDAAGGLPMVCGGTQRIVMAWLAPHAAHQQLAHKLLEPKRSTAPAHLIMRLEGNGSEYSRADLGLLDSDNSHLGVEPDAAVLEMLQADLGNVEVRLFEAPAGDTYCVERIYDRETLYVFGAGHVARPVVEIATLVGFQTVVLDDRPDFACKESFPRADEIRVVEDFNESLNGLSLCRGAYVVIVTRAHSHDQAVLESVLVEPCAYIGMIGSRTKVAQCFHSMKEKGFGQEQLARVHSPIGLKIGSETPEEIAVSIVAQLIDVRAQLKHAK